MSAAAMAEFLERAGVVVVIRCSPLETATRVARELADGEISAIEFSLTEPDALQALSVAAEELAGRVEGGAGTVLTAEQVDRAVEAGARYLISPTVEPAVIEQAAELDVLHLPGAFTPTEVHRASTLGSQMIKIFPSGLGPGHVSDLLGPFPDLKLVPTGGIHAGNAASFIAAGATALGVGSALSDPTLGEGEIGSRARELMYVVDKSRRSK